MNIHRRTKLGLTGAIATTLSVVIAGTKIVESKLPARQPEAPPRKILVVSLSRDAQLRKSFEDTLAGELSLLGATAIASYSTFPELPKERGPFEQKLVADGFDAVTVTRLVGMTDKLKEVEGAVAYSPEYLGSGWWGAYWYNFKEVNLPGYLEKETKVRVRTELWRTTREEGQMIWSGTSETFQPLTVAQTAREISAAVAKALAKAKLI